MNITIDLLEQWESCYTHKQHVELFAGRDSFTPLEIADLENVSAKDRLWVLLHPEIFTDQELRSLACDYAQHAIDHAVSHSGVVDQRSIGAVAVSRRFANGEATREELIAAREAAWAATREAKKAGAWAAWATTRDVGAWEAWATAWEVWEAKKAGAWGELLAITKTKLLEKQPTGTKS